MQKAQFGMRALLKPNQSPSATHCLILGLDSSNLFVRCVYKKEAVEWLLENVN